MKKNVWSQMTANDAIKRLNSNLKTGLAHKEVRIRQTAAGNNLDEGEALHPLRLLLHQFTDTMVLVLLVATVLSGLIGAVEDAVTIMAIVAINAVLGFVQEYRAEKSLEEMKKLSTPFTWVLRAGKKIRIPTADLVPGDIVFLETGDKIPADIRLLSTCNLEIEEAVLTGESVPAVKQAEIIPEPVAPLAELTNMAFMGTAVTKGRGIGLVVSIGRETVMGEIAHIIKNTGSKMTPLQIKLDQLGKILIIICLVVCMIVVVLGILRGEAIVTMLLAGISLAVAAIPEGLPAIVSVVLALGIQRMSKRNAIIRRLPAVETLGCTTVICSDKTGTLTQNKMTVRKLATSEKVVTISGDGYYLQGDFYIDEQVINPRVDKAISMTIKVAWHCNNSTFSLDGKKVETFGDPTEIALLVMAQKAGMASDSLRIKEVPFDAERKMMTTVIEEDGQAIVFVKGALEEIIKNCSMVVKGGQVIKLQNNQKEAFIALQDEWAKQALRVLGFAYKIVDLSDLKSLSDRELENELIFTGIVGMIDPPRPGVDKAVQACRKAGIIPIMITGDHPVTAAAIACEIGLADFQQVITGLQIDDLSDGELYEQGLSCRVFARVLPQHKNRIVKVLQHRNHVVAMTGDGVNDAPAVKAADIGIAMGKSGTEVTREASAMVLADDDFSTIVKAVYEGRAIYDNIRKFLRYLLGCNIGEILVMLLASLMGMPLPLVPIQILWVNLITDGLPAMALGMEPAEPFIMQRKPRAKNENVFAHGLGWTVLRRGIFISIIALLAFSLGLIYCRGMALDNLNIARTMSLTTLVFAQLCYAFECRSEKYSPFELGFFTNQYLIMAVLFSMIMQLALIYWPPLQHVFRTSPLEVWQWLIIIALAGSRLIARYIIFLGQRIRSHALHLDPQVNK